MEIVSSQDNAFDFGRGAKSITAIISNHELMTFQKVIGKIIIEKMSKKFVEENYQEIIAGIDMELLKSNVTQEVNKILIDNVQKKLLTAVGEKLK